MNTHGLGTTLTAAGAAAALVALGIVGGSASAGRAGGSTPTYETMAAAVAVQAGPTRAGSPSRSSSGKVVYLTFDDGPNPRYTPQVLALLKRHKARATFFMIGSSARSNPALVRRVKAEGHAVANHTYTHPWLTRIPASAVRSQLRRTDAVIGATKCMRPPGGFVNNSVRAVARREGKRIVMWTVDPADWSRPGAKAIASRVLNRTRSGSIVVMHDGGGSRVQTVAALSTLLPRLRAKGYRLEALPYCR